MSTPGICVAGKFEHKAFEFSNPRLTTGKKTPNHIVIYSLWYFALTQAENLLTLLNSIKNPPFN